MSALRLASLLEPPPQAPWTLPARSSRCDDCEAEASEWDARGGVFCRRHWAPHRLVLANPLPDRTASLLVLEHFGESWLSRRETQVAGALLLFGPVLGVLPRRLLISAVWWVSPVHQEGDWQRDLHDLRIVMKRLRDRIAPLGHAIQTHEWDGYRLICPPACTEAQS